MCMGCCQLQRAAHRSPGLRRRRLHAAAQLLCVALEQLLYDSIIVCILVSAGALESLRLGLQQAAGGWRRRQATAGGAATQSSKAGDRGDQAAGTCCDSSALRFCCQSASLLTAGKLCLRAPCPADCMAPRWELLTGGGLFCGVWSSEDGDRERHSYSCPSNAVAVRRLPPGCVQGGAGVLEVG